MWRGRISFEHSGDTRRPDLTKPKLKRKIFCRALKTQVLYLKWFLIHCLHYSSLLPFRSFFFGRKKMIFLTYATEDETLQMFQTKTTTEYRRLKRKKLTTEIQQHASPFPTEINVLTLCFFFVFLNVFDLLTISIWLLSYWPKPVWYDCPLASLVALVNATDFNGLNNGEQQGSHTGRVALLTVRTGEQLYCRLALCSDRFGVWSVLSPSSKHKSPRTMNKFWAVMERNQSFFFCDMQYKLCMPQFRDLVYVALNMMYCRQEVCRFTFPRSRFCTCISDLSHCH